MADQGVLQKVVPDTGSGAGVSSVSACDADTHCRKVLGSLLEEMIDQSKFFVLLDLPNVTVVKPSRVFSTIITTYHISSFLARV